MDCTIIGMPGQWAKDDHENSDHYTTKIGGVPDWPSRELSLDPGLLNCSLCGANLCLVTQVYAPISLDKLDIEDRAIYILACPMRKCANKPLSWRTIRVQKWLSVIHSNDDNLKENQGADLPTSASESHDFWGKDVHEMGSQDTNQNNDNDMNLEELGRALLEAASSVSCLQKQNGSTKSKRVQKNIKTKIKTVETKIQVLPCFYIYSQEEPSLNVINNACTRSSSFSIKDEESYLVEPDNDEKWEGEQYEYNKALKVDRTYLKFKKRIDACPEQCFRYSFGGKPLLPTKTIGNPGSCKLCGAMRHYEMQLMPSLLYFLQEAVDGASRQSLEEWNWTTVIIYTCSKSCFQESRKVESGADCWTVVEESTIILCEDLDQPISAESFVI